MKKNLKIKVNSIWFERTPEKTKVWVSIRDFELEKAMKEKRGIEIIFKNQKMTIPFEKLKEGRIRPEIYKSKYDEKEYRLVDFEWIPDRANDLSNPKVLSKLVL
jgi:hypothetical protein